jgi:ABC-type uncharacterized transport system permease subunit
MRTIKEFNEKYKDYLNHESGMLLEISSVLTYVDQIFQDLIKIPGFKYQQIRTVYGLAKVVTNLQEIIPFAGRILEQELEEKINFILKVEFEIENRLLTLNLDKDGKPLQSL